MTSTHMNAWTFYLWICRMFLHPFLWRIFSRAKFGSGTICDMFGFIHILLQHDLVWGDRGYWETIVAYMSVEDPDQVCLMHLISAFGEICLLKKEKKVIWFNSEQIGPIFYLQWWFSWFIVWLVYVCSSQLC